MTGEPDPRPFDICGPLPAGVTLLEASAGTGKTFTIAALTARYVAEGTPLDALLLVTFTRMATGELRERVRERLLSAEHGLARVLAGAAPPSGDQVLGLLASGPPDEVECRRHRLSRALADFDAATIVTTHGFCQHVLAGLGVTADVEHDARFVEDIGDLVEEVVDDLYVRRFHRRGFDDGVSLKRSEALEIARVVVDNPKTHLEPPYSEEPGPWATRRRFAEAVGKEVERRKRRASVMTYDDLITRLRGALADDADGGAARERLRSRYRVALVDEFQDTDPIQWDILRRAFACGGNTLVLVGDPKQAIYAFRGGDVYAYLAAAEEAGTEATLGVNWRSDQALLDAYDALFAGARLGHPRIAYRRVQAAEANREPGLVDAPVTAALRVRVVHRSDGLVPRTASDYLVTEPARALVAGDLAGDVVQLLRSGATVATRGRGADRWERVRPGHIAVLVRTNHHATLARGALEAAGVPAVVNGAGSVFTTDAAREWLRLLEALERPASPPRAASAALTSFVGWTAERTAAADDAAWDELHARLHRWADVLRRRGVASLLETITLAEALPGSLLARADGERALTDLRHVGQLLHTAATNEQLGVSALVGWLRERVRDAETDVETEERTRRLESDAEAVQVLTIHRSKGLEFPIVYCPYLWDPSRIRTSVPVFHDPAASDRRAIDVGGDNGPAYGQHRDQHVAEERGEELRLAYVALTRARHQAVLWWAARNDTVKSPLARLLFPGPEDDRARTRASRRDADVVARLDALASQVPGCISVERATGDAGAVWTGERHPGRALEARRFDRGLDPHWRRTSYSAITSQVHEGRVASEPEEALVSDEAPVVDAVAGAAGTDEAGLRSVPLPLGTMPAGVDVGTFVHGVLEATDFTAPDLDAQLTRQVAQEQARRQVDIGDPRVVVAGLRDAIETPLGPVMGDFRLRDVGPGDRVDELGFELPLVGGDRPSAELAVSQIAELLRHHLPAGDPIARYPARLADPTLQGELRGYLVGSLDLVVRVTAGDGVPRFAVVDHKTSRLGGAGEPLTAWHYRPAALAEEMQRAHYPLQALLYTAALHRYLRWRLPGYHPDRHLAGVLYLFLRGMVGPSTPRTGGQPCGVFAWRPPTPLVEALSDLLDRGAVAA